MWFDGDNAVAGRSRLDRATPAISPVRIALLFSSAAIAFALVAVSYFGDQRRVDRAELALADGAPQGVDMMATGSVRQARTYIVRKSILQGKPSAVCIISADGTRSGDC